MSEQPLLNERAQLLLKVLVERYIEDGKPVGSRSLSRDAGMELSPATIRNVMADLEELGLVTSPHTSAGRVPTMSGYRLFVDSLLTVKPMRSSEVQSMQSELVGSDDALGVIETATSLLSGLSQMAGVVTLPRHERVAFRHVEFLALSEQRVLAILVTNEREVHNRILHPQRQYTESELTQASNYLNEQFVGKELAEVRGCLVAEMRNAREGINNAMMAAMDMGEQLLGSEAEEDDDLVLSGQTNLMGFEELSNVERLRSLFEAFQEKQGILALLEQCLRADGVQIFIGNESGYEALDDCSVVSAPYTVNDQVVGVLGVIGPTRMAYERVIPLVDVTARLLSAALKKT